ncbi:MAG: endonuclease domain-containing protein [Proteobacteria bacterium]|nr:endonuclease domain-containing protein [Pseudomonadota bacterium]
MWRKMPRNPNVRGRPDASLKNTNPSISRARSLRADATLAERILWADLRRLRSHGLYFRRQVPIGRYTADFACHNARLVIELDGSQHTEAEAAILDEKRSAFINSEGYQVLRFFNQEVTQPWERELVVSLIVDVATSRLRKTAAPTR